MHRLVRRAVYRLSKSPLGRLLVRVVPAPVIWRNLAQTGELEFHRTNRWRATPDFARNTEALFGWMGLDPDAFDGKVVLDLGAGSRLRTAYFRGARIVVVEPLADRFLQEVEWCDLGSAERIYSRPAEEFIPELAGVVDAVVSINVLDHCFGFETILANVRRYLRADGEAILSFDSHDVADAMHPLVLTAEGCRAMMERAGFRIDGVSRGLGSLGSTYGHGEAITFRLSPV